MRTLLRSLSLAFVCGIVFSPAAEARKIPTSPPAQASATVTRYPVITATSPKRLRIGQTLTIRGRYFRPGAGKSSVAFYVQGRPVVFLKAKTATSKRITVVVTDRVLRLFAANATKARLVRLRVVGRKMGKRFTNNRLSVRITPSARSAPGTGPGGSGGGTGGNTGSEAVAAACAARAAANGAGDEDGDGLSNSVEISLGLDPCLADTDGDGVTDGFEYYSAMDLNATYNTGFIPYPAPRPFPNPLDPSDAEQDFDGDGLLLWQEHKLWHAAGQQLPITTYSDGTQRTGGIVTVPPGHPLDLDKDGQLTDDEKDLDNDGLSNIVEFNLTGVPDWWNAQEWTVPDHGGSGEVKGTEVPYAWRNFGENAMLDPTKADTDGDGIIDGLDDQDNDGWNNIIEMQVGRWDSGLRVHPFNPCLPDTHAVTCGRYLPLGANAENAHPPYNKSFVPYVDYARVRWPWNNSNPLYGIPGDNELWDGTTGP